MIDYTSLIGVPFVNCGRDKTKGLDCYGLVQEVYRQCGIDLPEYYADFSDAPKIESIIKESAKSKSWKRIGEPTVPCVIAFRFGSQYVNHTAVYIGAGKFLHTRDRVGVCVDRLSNPAWRKVIAGFYEYVGGTDDTDSNNKESV